MTIKIDPRLVRQAQRGDARATEEVATMCRQLLCRRLSGLGVYGDAQEDLAQKALEVVLRKLDGFEWRASFETWALAILGRIRCRQEQDERKLRGREMLEADTDPERDSKLELAPDPDGDPVDEVAKSALRDALADCLSRVPPERREVWLRHRLLQHEHHVIAKALNMNGNTVATRIYRADQSLRHCLEGKGLTPSAFAMG